MKILEMRNYFRAQLNSLHSIAAIDSIYKQLLQAFFNWEVTIVGLAPNQLLQPNENEKLLKALKALKAHQPLQYIIGHTSFCGLRIHLSPATLIPRPETEELVALILETWKGSTPQTILDIGTGSGCIALALKNAYTKANVIGIDNSFPALEVAKKNAALLQLEVDFKNQDLEGLQLNCPAVDILVSNPPYVHANEKLAPNVLDYEPHSALFSPKNDPLFYYEKIATYGSNALGPEGKVYFEINPLDAEVLKAKMIAWGYIDVQLKKDIFGKLRFLTASKS